jgi:hypothetical protein
MGKFETFPGSSPATLPVNRATFPDSTRHTGTSNKFFCLQMNFPGRGSIWLSLTQEQYAKLKKQ